MKKAIYPGSFDVPTIGHKYILSVAGSLFDEVVVVVGENPMKKYWFQPNERLKMMETMVSNMGYKDDFRGRWILGSNHNISVQEMTNDYTVYTAMKLEATWVVRGIRSASDYENEDMIANFNNERNAHISTVLIPSPDYLKRISSSFVKSLVGYGGWEDEVQEYLPNHIAGAFVQRATKILDKEVAK